MRTTRRDILLGAAAFGLASIASRLPAYAQDASAAPEKPELMFGVGGKPLFYYLPSPLPSARDSSRKKASRPPSMISAVAQSPCRR